MMKMYSITVSVSNQIHQVRASSARVAVNKVLWHYGESQLGSGVSILILGSWPAPRLYNYTVHAISDKALLAGPFEHRSHAVRMLHAYNKTERAAYMQVNKIADGKQVAVESDFSTS
jgi:hypothetical protein